MTSLSIFERTIVVIHSVTTLNLYCADYVENKIQLKNSIQRQHQHTQCINNPLDNPFLDTTSVLRLVWP